MILSHHRAPICAILDSMIVNKKDRKLKKGSGYHLDLILIGAFASLCGILGLPFVCAATVRSVTHVSALSVFSRTNAPGEKPHLEEVKEQRLTGFAVHVVIGMCEDDRCIKCTYKALQSMHHWILQVFLC